MKDSTRQWVSKLLVVGEGGVGKTSLLRALRGEAFDPQESTTHGIDIHTLGLIHPNELNVTMQLNTWDFGGQEIYHATHQFFLTNRSLFLLAWNARLGFEQGKLYYWLDTIQALAPNSPVLLVATWIDERPADLPLIELRNKYPQIIGHCEISNRAGTGIERLREDIAAAAATLPLMGEVWPTNWLEAANALRTKSEKYVTPQRLWNFMLEYNVDANSAAVLIQWLHELGDILYFRDTDELNDIVILKPQWVSEYISKVLESYEVIERFGVFTRQHMNSLWYDIDSSIRDHFLRLMERFDLSYRTLENREISLVVERLPLDPPQYERVWNNPRTKDDCNEITMKFKLNTIPAGIPTWFIARSHRFSTYTHWRNGAVFAYEAEQNHLALVQAFPHDRYVTLSVRGPHPQTFFALLRDGFEVTLARFPGLQVTRLIPCPGHNGRSCSHEFDYHQLLKRINKKPIIECPEGLEDISVTALLFGLHWSTQDVVLARLDELEASEVVRYEETITAIENLRVLTQRAFTDAFRREQAKIEAHCPNIFVLRPHDITGWRKYLDGMEQTLVKQSIDLQLFCQAPGAWHPTSNGGLYQVEEPAEWLSVAGPYLRRLVSVLKYAAPLVGPWLGIMMPDDYEKQWKNDITFMDALVKKMPDIKHNPEQDLAAAVGETSQGEQVEGAPLRALRSLLDKKDPQQYWGGLKKVLTPEGHYLWLCDHHAKEYKR